jgi:hypothetical protein
MARLCRRECWHLLKVLTHDRNAVCWPAYATAVAIKYQKTFPATGTLPAFKGRVLKCTVLPYVYQALAKCLMPS